MSQKTTLRMQTRALIRALILPRFPGLLERVVRGGMIPLSVVWRLFPGWIKRSMTEYC